MQPAPSFRPPLILGIAGGSGSGKSTIARAVLEALPAGQGVLLQQDHYYRSQAHLPEAEKPFFADAVPDKDNPPHWKNVRSTVFLDALEYIDVARPGPTTGGHGEAEDGGVAP